MHATDYIIEGVRRDLENAIGAFESEVDAFRRRGMKGDAARIEELTPRLNACRAALEALKNT